MDGGVHTASYAAGIGGIFQLKRNAAPCLTALRSLCIWPCGQARLSGLFIRLPLRGRRVTLAFAYRQFHSRYSLIPKMPPIWPMKAKIC